MVPWSPKQTRVSALSTRFYRDYDRTRDYNISIYKRLPLPFLLYAPSLFYDRHLIADSATISHDCFVSDPACL